jgi:hypothetical protein
VRTVSRGAERRRPIVPRRLLAGGVGVAALGLLLAVGCEPQEIYLFDGPPTRAGRDVDAGREDEPNEPPPPDAGPEDPLPSPPPACETEACEACVTSGACSVGSTVLFCHPRSGECALPCDASAGAQAPGNCPAGQLCAPGGICVGCLGGGDCAGQEPACDLTRNRCVECVVGGDTCPLARPVCDPDELRCVECNADDECGTGLVCFEEAQRCVQCQTDLDCRGSDDDVLCLPGENRCVECVTDADCRLSEPDKPFCSSERECEDERK